MKVLQLWKTSGRPPVWPTLTTCKQVGICCVPTMESLYFQEMNKTSVDIDTWTFSRENWIFMGGLQIFFKIFSVNFQPGLTADLQNDKQPQIIGQKHLLILTHTEIFVFRASQGEKADNTFDSQVVQYEPAHQGSINTVTNLSPDLCVSGGSDQVNSSGFKTSTRNKSPTVLFERKSES